MADYKEIRVRRDTIANFVATGYVPANGEPIGLIGPDGKVTAYLIGDGSSTVDQLPALSKGDKGAKGDAGPNSLPSDTATAQYLLDPAARTGQAGRAVAKTTRGPGIGYRSLAQLTQQSYSSPTLNAILALSRDGSRLYVSNSGFSSGQLGVTLDGGATITWGKSFLGSNGILQGIVELHSGEVEVSVQHRDNTPGEVYRSTGWNPATADAASWTVVLTSSGTANHFDGRWGFTQHGVAPTWSDGAGDRYYVEYGTHTNESSAPGTAAVRAWRVTDTTVTEIFNLANQYASIATAAALHCHGITYDPYADQVIITTGDGGATNGQSDVWVKNREDLDDGKLWTSISHSTSGSSQCTAVAAIPTGLVLLSDYATGGVRFVARHGFRIWGPPTTSYKLPGSGPIGGLIWTYPEQPGAVCLMAFQSVSGSGAPVILATVNGRDVFQVHAEASSVTGSAPGIRYAVGPDSSGRVFAYRNLGDGSPVLLTGKWAPVLPTDASSGSTPAPSPGVVPGAGAASRSGLLAHTYPAHQAGSTSTALTSGTVYVAKVTAESAAAAAARSVRFFQNTASAGLTLAKVAVFDSSGNQLGVSSDISSLLNGSGNTGRTVGVGSFALTAGSDYYIALVVVGTTGPVLVRSSNSGVANVGLSGAGLLWSTAATGQTDMPASIAPASLSAQPVALWFGLL
jgi:hypothetical protein